MNSRPLSELLDIAPSRNHEGLDFETSAKVFNDPNFALLKDRIDEESGEQRWHAIGEAPIDEGAVLLPVAHVYRSDDDEEEIRIISARKADKRERRVYLQ